MGKRGKGRGQPLGRSRHPFLEHDGILAFAHRGGASEFPENTMPAFQAAVDLGYTYLETDAYCTSDGVLLAFHDDVLDRVTSHKGRIEDLPYATIREALVEGREPIPLLEDVLTAWPHTKVNIDPKHDAAVEPLIALLRRLNTLDRVCVGSFSGARLKRLRSAFGPGLCTSMGPSDVLRLKAAEFHVPVGGFDALCVQVPLYYGVIPVVTRGFVRAAHRRGLQVHVWTVDDANEMERLIDLGIDGIMTDRPRILKEVLRRRGLWS